MAALWTHVFLIKTALAFSHRLFGHHGHTPGPGGTIDYQVNTLIIPDRNQVFLEDGKLLSVAFNGTSGGVFRLVILREDWPGTLKVTRVTNWGAGSRDMEYGWRYGNIPDWHQAVFSDGYLPVFAGEFIGVLFEYENTIYYKNTNCTDGSPYMRYVLPPGGMLYDEQDIVVTLFGECRRYDYIVSYVAHGECVNVTLRYSLNEIESEITGFYVDNLEQRVMGSDSICWWVVAPPRPDGKEAVVEFYARDLPWGYEVAESGHKGDKPSYCVGAGLEIKDGGTGEFLDSICSDTPMELRSIFSRTNVMVIRFYGDQPAKFTGDVYAGLKEHARYRDEEGSNMAPVIVIPLVVIIILGLCSCSGMYYVKTKKKVRAVGVSKPPVAPGYGETPPTQGHGQVMAPPPQSHGQPLIFTTAGYAQPVAPPQHGYGQHVTPLPYVYGQPVTPPLPQHPTPIGPDQQPLFYAMQTSLSYADTSEVPPPAVYIPHTR